MDAESPRKRHPTPSLLKILLPTVSFASLSSGYYQLGNDIIMGEDTVPLFLSLQPR